MLWRVSRTSELVGGRIRSLRQAQGLSQEALGSLLGRRQATISNWENGRGSPSVEDLYELAAALALDPRELLPELPPRAAPVRALLRAARGQLPVTEEMQSTLTAVAERAMQLPRRGPELSVRGKTPRELADAVLTAGGVAEPPVDVADLASKLGAATLSWSLDDAIAGIVMELPDGPAIAVNSGHPRGRQRFTLAHELGHLLLGHLRTVYVDVAAVDGLQRLTKRSAAVEHDANMFAANLLMPEPWVREAWTQTSDTRRIADWFDVSEIAMGYRLMGLSLSPSSEDEVAGQPSVRQNLDTAALEGIP